MAEFQHIGISVSDLDRAVRWYAARFGYQETKRFAKPELKVCGAVMTLGSAVLEILQSDSPQPARSAGFTLAQRLGELGANHFAIGVSDVTQCYATFERDGVGLVSGLIDGRFFFCTDPDGTLLEVRRLG